MTYNADMKITFNLVVLILETVYAEHASNGYSPFVKMDSNSSVESTSTKYCVTKEYIDELFVNISNRLEEQDCTCNAERSKYDHATQKDIAELNSKLMNISAMIMEKLKPKPIDCEAVQNEKYQITGIYTIYPFQIPNGISVRCDMDTSTGGWTVIQRRVSDSDFYKTWAEYEAGFGNLSENFWLGNRNIHMITHQDRYELRVDLTSKDGETAYAQYREFSLGSVEVGYKLFVGLYSGTAGDSLHNGYKFSTYDRDNDIYSGGNCAVSSHGAWWYDNCHASNLNGDYGNFARGVGPVWTTWKGANAPMIITEMKIRRIR